jgi:hypothetical protein
VCIRTVGQRTGSPLNRLNWLRFNSALTDYAVSDDTLIRLALIVRAADVKGQESVAAEGIGLRSIAQGFAAMGPSDEDRLALQISYL